MNKIYLLVFTVLFFSACSKDVVEVLPQPATASFSRTFFFPRTSTSEAVVSNNTPPVIVAATYDNTGSLALGFEVNLPTGRDLVSLAIKKDKLKNGIIGEYVISPFLGAGKPPGDVDVTYGYSTAPPATLFFLPGSGEGLLKITGYNEKLRSITGNFTIRINADKDPRAATNTVWETTQIDLGGSFANVKLAL